MTDAVEAGYDLGGIALCLLALGALLAVKGMVQAVAGVFDVSILGFHPLRGIANALESSIVGALDDAIKSTERLLARFLSGLIDSFGLLLALPALGILGTKAALEYLWNHALRPLIHSITNGIKATADQALAKVTALEGTVAADLDAAERYARERASSALTSAEAYVDTKIAGAISTLRQAIAEAIGEAERYADQAIGRLRSAEDAAIASVATVAAQGIAEAERLAAAEVTTAEGLAAGAIASARSDLELAIDGAIAQGKAETTALAQVVSGEIATLEQAIAGAAAELPELTFQGIDYIRGKLGELDLSKLSGLIAAIPLVGAIATSIAAKGWLWCDNVGNVGRALCGLPGDLVGALLGDALAALALADLCELVHLMQIAAGEFEPVLRELVVAADALIGCHGTTAAPDLELAGVELPIPRAPLALA